MQELCKELKLPKQLLECTSAEMIQVLSRIPLHSSLNGDDGAADQTRAGTPIIHTHMFASICCDCRTLTRSVF